MATVVDTSDFFLYVMQNVSLDWLMLCKGLADEMANIDCKSSILVLGVKTLRLLVETAFLIKL